MAHSRIEERRAAESSGWRDFREQAEAQLSSRTERLVEAQKRAWKLSTMPAGISDSGIADLASALADARAQLLSVSKEVEQLEQSTSHLQQQVNHNRSSLSKLQALETKLKDTV